MSFRLKTILGIALIEAVLLLLLISTVLAYMRDASERSLENYAQTTVNLFAATTKNAVLSYDLASLDAFVNEVTRNPEVAYARVLAPDGRVLADAGKLQLLAAGFHADVNAGLVADGYYDIEASIAEGGAVYGTVQLGISNAVTTALISEARDMALLIAIVEMGLVALFSLLLGIYLTNRLQKIRRAAQHLARGEFGFQVEVDGRDEIGEVAATFNQMSETLANSIARRDEYESELRRLNQHLEQRVQNRTADLMDKNQLLETAYNQLKSTQAQLVHAEKLSSIGQLAAGVAHEINNPLSYVRSNLEALTDYVGQYRRLIQHYENVLPALPISGAQRREFAELRRREDMDYVDQDCDELLEQSLGGVDRVAQIVQSLKDFSRQDRTELVMNDLQQCIESTLKIVHNQLKYKCELQLDLDHVPPFLFNRGKLSQVLLNLLVNAAQSITGQGTITIRTRLSGRDVLIEVEDTGSGIPAEHIEKLFDPFFTTKPVGEGTGLGLAISAGIVREHQGTLEVRSELGQGSCFTIRLPFRQTPEAARST